MGIKKLSEESTVSALAGDTHVVVSQTVEVDGVATHAVRRVPLDDFAGGLPIPTDSTPTENSTNLVQSGGVYTKLTELKEDLSGIDGRVTAIENGGIGLTDAMKSALLQIAQKVAYIDANGQTYYDALYDAFYNVSSVYLDTNSIALNSLGATSQLTATTVPSGGSVEWTSSDTSVATVSSSGLVTAIAYGSCTITATSGNASATCSVVITQA